MCMSVGLSAGISWLVLSLASGSGNIVWGSVSFIGGRIKSNIWGGVSISLYISVSVTPGLVAMLSVDADSNGIGKVLISNSGH